MSVEVQAVQKHLANCLERRLARPTDAARCILRRSSRRLYPFRMDPNRGEMPMRPLETSNESQSGAKSPSQAIIAFSSGSVPKRLMTRMRLSASTRNLISVCARGRVLVRKCAWPIHTLMVPKGCSTVRRRRRIGPRGPSSVAKATTSD